MTQWTILWMSDSTNDLVNEWLRDYVNEWFIEQFSEWVIQGVIQSMNHSVSGSVNEWFNEPVIQCLNCVLWFLLNFQESFNLDHIQFIQIKWLFIQKCFICPGGGALRG